MNALKKTMDIEWALATTLCLLFSAALASAQSIVHSFDGDKGPALAACRAGVGHCGRQPEMTAAANGREVVQVTWQNVLVYDYGGKLLRSTPLSTFINNAGLEPMPPEGKGPYEPHVVYDEFVSRWIVTVSCRSDCLIVSDSPDPAGKWGGVYLSCLQGGPCLNRDPGLKLGYDKNGVYSCGAHFGDDNPHTVPGLAYDCFAIPLKEVTGIAQGTAPIHVNRAHNMPLDILPAIDHNQKKSAIAPAFFAAKSCGHSASNACQKSSNFYFHWIVETFTWNGVAGKYNAGGEQAIKTDIGSSQNKWLYNSPCCGAELAIPQAGSDVRLRAATSHRLMNLVQFGAHLQGVLGSGPCTRDCGSQGVDKNNVMIWVDLDCSKLTTCVVSQTAKIAGAEFSPEFGTVGVDERGNVGILAVSSSASTDLGLLLWTRLTSDAPNKFRGPITVISGTQPHTCLQGKNIAQMGSAVGILTVRDPLDGMKLWTSQQWSNDATPCVWNTRIVEYEIADGNAPKSNSEKRR